MFASNASVGTFPVQLQPEAGESFDDPQEWYASDQLDALTQEEVGIIAHRLLHRLQANTAISPEQQHAFLDRIHALVAKGKPWRNGFIERSNRTDKEELFTQHRFIDSEDRRYQLKLWEMEYNCHRPHQGLHNQLPFEVYRRDYPLHAAS